MAASNGLNIYKASAGSGKTFLLVGEYLKMLFAKPKSYRNILAVTFTNKATAEMKDRILKELGNLSNGSDSRYLELLRDVGSEQKIREKAKDILKLILHDYSRFSVMTIDSFFQKVIRAFAREIRLNASFHTEIDNRQALEEAIDLLFQEIEGNALLMDWMILFLEENLEEGRSWDFRQELLKFGKEVEKEAFKIFGDEFAESLAGKESLSLYVQTIRQVALEADDRLRKIGQEAIELILRSGLTIDQFKGGKNTFVNIFYKLRNGKFEEPTKTVLEAIDRPENWYKKTDTAETKAQIEAVYHGGLNRFLKEAVDSLSVEIPKINSALAILKNIYPFGLLGNITLKIKEVLKENNRVLLSDTGRMIGKIIEGNDTPYIYEKVGLIYHHFMLDEFQDTSVQQWYNFKPLIENALASGYSSLVVGDVKQSIYRWRNGDWNLLANQLVRDLSHQRVKEEVLDKNWRSRKNIVDFNNTLFWSSSAFLDRWFEEETTGDQYNDLHGVISQAYGDPYQICSHPGKPEGHVKITFVDAVEVKYKSGFRELAMVHLIGQLEEVQKSGVKADGITILVRENSEAGMIAKALWERKKSDPQPGCIYDVITSDTLKIGQSQVVRFVVNFFRFFTRNETQKVRAEILYAYYRILKPGRMTEGNELQIDLHGLFDPGALLPDLFKKWLDEDPNAEFVTGILALPLYELAVSIVDHFELGTIVGEKLFLQAFLDMVLEYGRDDFGGIAGFLEWWEASGSNKTLNLTNIQNFIRISSIHQSKGLEYPTVFIPFCNWEVGLNPRKLPYIWSIPEIEPFNYMKMVLLKCDSSLKNSIFSYDYNKEFLYSILDNLNLLYVAATRAINNLFIIMPYKEEIKKPGNVAELVQTLIEHPRLLDSIDQEKYFDFGKFWDSDRKIFEIGSMESIPERELTATNNRPNDPLLLSSSSNRMKIRLHSKDYFQLTGNRQAEKINKGTLMHQIFEKIKTRKDVEDAVSHMVVSGALNFWEGKEIYTKIDELLKEEPYANWFSDRWRVLTERDILRVGESRHRPDRVLLRDNSAIVIDYKTGEKSDKDIRQMKGYLIDLKKMGYTSCEGNIWYLQKNEVVQVDF
ncbi:MAG: UvrD-helicase domain-containing protein [Prolixibacteraceae bacterium]|jgi:ATP-dependent exoDNAse (exonuclease V) beta subunit|nr:UvrD-helicase domain-containing protein [Prolixibacteraceae bacterium]